MHKKLFIPGPTKVSKEVLAELSNPQIGHRTQEFFDLFAEVQKGLKKVFLSKKCYLLRNITGLLQGPITPYMMDFFSFLE